MTPPPDHVAAKPEPRLDDLAQIIGAYNEVTDRLQRSHETLQQEVLRLRRELASTNAQLERSKRLSALGEMAAGIAHEIRNPLAAIQLYAGMVVEDLSFDPRPDIAIENTRKIEAAVRGLNAIVCDVLNFAREFKPQPRLTPAAGLLASVVEAHRPAIDAAGVEVVCEADDSLAFHADPDLLRQALLNLVRNAVDAMAPHAAPRRLTLVAGDEGDGVELAVSDTGPGIDGGTVDRIFNPFFTTRNTGTGLGLAIVHRIVDAHGGAIAVRNAPGGGAVFTLSLPARPAAAAEPPAVPSGVAA